ncbi:hypothetical protein ElyMa_005798100 [Elysia marginata]|uniref:Uncharacterized protein n=1 Tax=Elysia marginata TaxID=1093978 RepID=A0AAV4FSL7_9GAST|nr:hypothetical protein ElyMa_005798100 [Elysia marginata]
MSVPPSIQADPNHGLNWLEGTHSPKPHHLLAIFILRHIKTVCGCRSKSSEWKFYVPPAYSVFTLLKLWAFVATAIEVAVIRPWLSLLISSPLVTTERGSLTITDPSSGHLPPRGGVPAKK